MPQDWSYCFLFIVTVFIQQNIAIYISETFQCPKKHNSEQDENKQKPISQTPPFQSLQSCEGKPERVWR